MIHLLPTNLARLAEHADKKYSGGRFALNVVRVEFGADGSYHCDATDTKHLVRISGPAPMPADEFPLGAVPALEAAPNGQGAALIPADSWKAVQGKAAKLKRGPRGMGCVMGEKQTTFGMPDGNGGGVVETVWNGEGRFPLCNEIISHHHRQGRTVTRVDLDAKMLAGILLTAAATVCDEKVHRVTLEITTDLTDNARSFPVRVLATNATTGQTLTAIQMPLAPLA